MHSVLCTSKYKRNQFLSRKCKIKEIKNKTVGFSGYCQFLNWKLSILQCTHKKLWEKFANPERIVYCLFQCRKTVYNTLNWSWFHWVCSFNWTKLWLVRFFPNLSSQLIPEQIFYMHTRPRNEGPLTWVSWFMLVSLCGVNVCLHLLVHK